MYGKPDVSKETNTCNKKIMQENNVDMVKKALVSRCAFNQN